MFETLSPCISHIRRIVHQSLKIPFHIPPHMGAECWAMCASSNKIRTYGNDGDGCWLLLGSRSLAPYSTYQRFDQPQMHLTASKQRQRHPYAIYVSFVPSFLLDNGRETWFFIFHCVCACVWFGLVHVPANCVHLQTVFRNSACRTTCALCARSIVSRRRKTEGTYTQKGESVQASDRREPRRRNEIE